MTEDGTEQGIKMGADSNSPSPNQLSVENAPGESTNRVVEPGDTQKDSADGIVADLHAFLWDINKNDEDAGGADSKKLDSMLSGMSPENVSRKDDGITALHIAARRGLTRAVKQLIEAKADVNAQDEYGDTPLHDACWQGQGGIVSLLLEHDARTDTCNNDEWTCLHTATKYGNTDIVGTLLRNGAKLNAVDTDNRTPLMLATRNEDENIIRKLLEPRQEHENNHLEIKDDDGNTPLMWAVTNEFAAGVDLFIRAGADCNTRSSTHATPIIAASSMGNREIVSVLLRPENRTELDIDAQDDEGQTALHHAIRENHPAVVKLLMEAESKANVWTRDIDGKSALDLASLLGNETILKTILRTELGIHESQVTRPPQGAPGDGHGNSPSDEGRHGLTAENTQEPDTRPGQRSAVVRILQQRTDKPNISMKLGRVLLDLAAETSDKELTGHVVENMSLDDGKDSAISPPKTVNSDKDSRGFGALLTWAAGYSKRHYAAKLLIKKRWSKPFRDDQENWGAIEWAAWAGLSKELWLLIASSPRDEDTIRAVETAKALKAKALNAGKEVGQGLDDTIEDPPYGVMQVWDSQTLSLPTFDTDGLFKPSQKPAKEQTPTQEQKPANEQRFDFLKDFKAVLIQFYKGQNQFATIRRDRAVRQVIYDKNPRSGPRGIMKQAREKAKRHVKDFNDTDRGTARTEQPIYMESEPSFTWVHLPSTNMVWMNDLLQRIMKEEKDATDEGRDRYNAHDFLQIKSFLANSWVEVPDRTSASRILRPRFAMRGAVKPTGHRKNDTERNPVTDNIPEKSEQGAEEQKERGEKDGEKDMRLGVEGEWHDEHAEQMHKSQKDAGNSIIASAAYMPYFSYSMHCCKTDDDGKGEECNQSENTHGSSETQDSTDKESRKKCYNARRSSKQLLDCYEGHTIHRSSTLDEWYYHFRSDPDSQKDRKDRNKTQVATKSLPFNPDKSIHWPLIRVNQLWLWTIDKKWLITASPHPLDDQENTLVEGILDYLRRQREYGGSRSQPGSTDEMSELIVEYCIESYERRPDPLRQAIGKDLLSIRQVFSNSINVIGRDETKLFDQFRSQEAQDKQGAEEKMKEAVKKAEELSAKIKDIRDELNILKATAQYQRDVQERMYMGHSGGNQVSLGGKDMRRVLGADLSGEHVVNDIMEMDIVANRVQEAVNTTLSLQQSKFANEQAGRSVKQGEEAERQGKTLMVFTVVTILFLPLSFLSSLFALDVASFQQAPDWAFAVIFSVSIAFFMLVTPTNMYSEIATVFGDNVRPLGEYVRNPRLLVDSVKGLLSQVRKPGSKKGESGTTNTSDSGPSQKGAGKGSSEGSGSTGHSGPRSPEQSPQAGADGRNPDHMV